LLQVEDPDLALIMGMWGRLADEIEARLIEIIQANLTTELTGRGTTNSEQ